jgi:hypothetical protein
MLALWSLCTDIGIVIVRLLLGVPLKTRGTTRKNVCHRSLCFSGSSSGCSIMTILLHTFTLNIKGSEGYLILTAL